MRSFFPEHNGELLRLQRNGAVHEECARLRRRIDEEGGHLFRLLPVCLVFDQDEARVMSSAARGLLALQTRLLSERLARDGREGVLRFAGIDAESADLVDWEELLEARHLVGRVDILIGQRGVKFCEFNVDSCVAGGELHDIALDFWVSVGVEDLPRTGGAIELLAEMIVHTVVERRATRIVLLDWSTGGGSGGKGYFDLRRIEAAVRARSDLPVHVVDEKSVDAAWLEPDVAREVVAHRFFTLEEMDDKGAFLRRVRKAGWFVNGGYETEIRTDKAWFAIYHEALEQGRLSRAERTMVETFVPQTRLLDENNLEKTIDTSHRLVFKARHSFGGDGIVLGAETDPATLRRILLEAGLENWVAQDLVRTSPLEFAQEEGGLPVAHDVVFGLYIAGAATAGMLVRASCTSRVVNATSGKAGSSWAVVASAAQRGTLLERLKTAPSA